ncbi:hypothetical protein H6A03_05680 [[Clostridium] spiroforme]|nr:hypothetical protein [Thomasclavelia spiroformis]MBM6879966.1 hypothetical protein [Thomasclavelia spiroformis]
MKKEDERLSLGEKTTRKNLIGWWVIVSVFGLIGATIIYNTLRIYFAVPFKIYLSLAIIIYIVIVLFLMPLLSGSAERITFDDDYICYYHIKGYVNQIHETIRIIMNREEKPDIKVKTEDIQLIELSVFQQLSYRGFMAYRLKMTFLLKNGTEFYLFPITTDQMKNGDYEKIFRFLESHDIAILDHEGLRPYLSQDMYAFQKYAASKKKQESRK